VVLKFKKGRQGFAIWQREASNFIKSLLTRDVFQNGRRKK
jgi:hypothetical protein